MKTIIVAVLLTLIAALPSIAQESRSRIDSSNATVTWKKYTIPNTNKTWVQIINWSTTTDIFYALNNDTTGAGVVRLYAGYNKVFPSYLQNPKSLWVKSASGTVRVHVLFDFP